MTKHLTTISKQRDELEDRENKIKALKQVIEEINDDKKKLVIHQESLENKIIILELKKRELESEVLDRDE